MSAASRAMATAYGWRAVAVAGADKRMRVRISHRDLAGAGAGILDYDSAPRAAGKAAPGAIDAATAAATAAAPADGLAPGDGVLALTG